MTVADRLSQVAEVLVWHQRIDPSGCVCGPLPLGSSHPRHQAEMLAAGGLLPETTTEWGAALGGEGFDAVAIAVDEGAARAFSRPIRREVTAWVPADEGNDRG